MGKLSLMGRYHKLPRRLQDEYYVTRTVLGSGCSGNVLLASRVDLKNPQTFAVKILQTGNLTADEVAHLQAEIEIFLCMDHPHVARLVDVYETEKSISLVMECMSGGEVFDRVLKQNGYREGDAADTIKQMLLAVNYVHRHGIVHRDLKLENFLYESRSGRHLKLIDFGFSKFCDTTSRMHTSCGTLAYVAPEVLLKSYNSQCDLWSMGVIAFIVLSGHMPFYGKEHQQVRNIKMGKYIMKAEHWKGVSPEAKNFVKALLKVNPSERLTAKEALNHEWLRELCPDPVLDQHLIVSALRSWRSAPALLRAFMSMMAWSLSNVQQASVRKYFLAMDKNHDGAISLAELQALMIHENGTTSDEIASIFKMFSECHDKEIHYSDVLAAMSLQHIDPDDDLLRTTFRKFDTRGIGYITAHDFRAVLGNSFCGGRADMLIREADVLHHDGAIDFEEFAEYVRARQKDYRVDYREMSSTMERWCAPTLLESHSRQAYAQKRRQNSGDNHDVTSPAHTKSWVSIQTGSLLRKTHAKHACCSLM
eukprot:CAMPEP_0169358642 /NCGR_PEP_ID=MMETSP1017-20121227/28800_1 /TAXON_ID=342587 /ORGANISM="Karlodinium micrum, Strain CCMP2283" /LENGTH=534 /DNA_ID=CAMNT_0009455741 /DNA_START=9 /DNA_END=1614 /DNA_ORIENTATION=+